MSDNARNFSQPTPPTSFVSTTINPSRKRSREEISDDGTDPSIDSLAATAVSPEPIYGEGMVLINPSTGVSTSAESQTGTWYEEKLEAELQATTEAKELVSAQASERLVMPMRKCQRRDSSFKLDPVRNGQLCSVDLQKSGPEEPAIDVFTHLLGVGWARVGDSDPDMQAAARGYARYIENHYPLSGVAVVLKSRGLDAYLVQAVGGFYLFKEDLSEGQLVGSDWEKCLANLQRSPMAFEGTETLKTVRTPDLSPIISREVGESASLSSSGGSLEESVTSMEDSCMDLD
jgi:hypothetical protein